MHLLTPQPCRLVRCSCIHSADKHITVSTNPATLTARPPHIAVSHSIPQPFTAAHPRFVTVDALFDCPATASSWSPAFSPDQMALYFVIGLATTALPAFLYHGIYSVDIHTYSLVYIAVCLVSSTLLTLAYKQTENNTHLSLAAARAAQPLPRHLRSGSKEAVLREQEQVTTLEAASWGFLLVNVLYVVLFLVLAFYVLKAFDVPYDYALSSVLASVGAWQIGAAISK